MARLFLGGVLPDHPAVRPVHREGHLAVHPVRPEGRHLVRRWEDRQRREAHLLGRMGPRWGAELRVRIVG